MNASPQLTTEFHWKPVTRFSAPLSFLFVISFPSASIYPPAVAVYAALILNACGLLV